VIVSNHGGRQLDTVPATIDVLPDIVEAVGDTMVVMLDSGIRRGTDVLKALAFGAQTVMIGRPVMWGLAVGGEDGVRDVLRILHAELDNAMALCGCPTVQDITVDLIRKT
jgi:isopentenyl diphosphate isomerase/L-lactate dehydrogenase-like FMN-dependent dehydrogenase